MFPDAPHKRQKPQVLGVVDGRDQVNDNAVPGRLAAPAEDVYLVAFADQSLGQVPGIPLRPAHPVVKFIDNQGYLQFLHVVLVPFS